MVIRRILKGDKNIDTVILGANTYKQIKNELSANKWVYEDLQSYILTKKK